jgi:hypothetical protein
MYYIGGGHTDKLLELHFRGNLGQSLVFVHQIKFTVAPTFSAQENATCGF